MPRDLGQWLHDTAVEPSGPVEPRSLIARGRRRRRIRRGVAATGSVAAVVLVGLLVVGPFTGPPEVVLESGPGVQQPRPEAEAGAPFVPPSAVHGGLRVLALRFPDGVTAEIAYPADVDVHEQGATPGGVLSIAGDEDETARRYGRARTSRRMEVRRGELDDVLRRLNDGDAPEVLAEYEGPGGDAVPLVSLAMGDYLVWQAGDWALLLPDAVGDGPALSDADRALYAAHVHPGEDADGWLTVRADPPLRTEQAYMFLGDPDAAVQHARDPAPHPQAEGGSDRLLVHASACTRPERLEEPSTASWCDLDTQLSFDVAGADAFVQQLTEGLQTRAADYPADVIDPAWVTDEERQAWEAEHGNGTWIVGYFYPPDFDVVVGHGEFEEVLERRWKRISDADSGLDREAGLREALMALTGPPPPRLATSWQGRELELTAARLDEPELTLDFDVLLAAGEGSTGGAAMSAQFHRTVFHHYPEAASVCVLLEGEPTSWLHDATTCPTRMTS